MTNTRTCCVALARPHHLDRTRRHRKLLLPHVCVPCSVCVCLCMSPIVFLVRASLCLCRSVSLCLARCPSMRSWCLCLPQATAQTLPSSSQPPVPGPAAALSPVASTDGVSVSPLPPPPPPGESILRRVIRENPTFPVGSNVFAPSFVQFVYDMASSISALPPVSTTAVGGSVGVSTPAIDELAFLRSATVLGWIARFTLEVVIHSDGVDLLRGFVDRLVVLFNRCPVAGSWLLGEAAARPSLMLRPMLTALDPRVRSNLARLLFEVVSVVLPLEASFLDEREATTATEVTPQPRSKVVRLLTSAIAMMPGMAARLLLVWVWALALFAVVCCCLLLCAVVWCGYLQCLVLSLVLSGAAIGMFGGLVVWCCLELLVDGVMSGRASWYLVMVPQSHAEAVAARSTNAQYWWLFQQLAVSGHAGRQLLCSNRAVAKLCHVFMAAGCVTHFVFAVCTDRSWRLTSVEAPDDLPVVSCTLYRLPVS